MTTEGRSQVEGAACAGTAGWAASRGGRLGISLLMGVSLTRISVVVARGKMGDKAVNQPGIPGCSGDD